MVLYGVILLLSGLALALMKKKFLEISKTEGSGPKTGSLCLQIGKSKQGMKFVNKK